MWYFLLLAAAFAWLGWRQTRALLRARASLGWPHTAGRMRHEGPYEGSVTSEQTPNLSLFASPRFSYVVDGREYDSGHSEPGIMMILGLRNDSEFRKLPQGQRVEVFYDPGKPEEAVLKPGASVRHYVEFALAWLGFAVLLAFGLFIWLRGG